MRVGQEVKTVGAMKMFFTVRIGCFVMKIKLYERGVELTVT